jgi:hypothetical protein
VVAVTKDAEGAVNTARGERVKMLLVDVAPTTKPTTQPVQVADARVATTQAQATTQATTKPSKEYAGMSNKAVRHVQFEQDAVINSETLADDGSLLRRTHLTAATIGYEMLTKKLTVPVPGRMLVEDHRPTTKPAAGQAQAAGAAVGGTENKRGTTGFEWSKTFTYDDAQRLAVMTGDLRNPVTVSHRDDGAKPQKFFLTGETVAAELESAAPAPVAPGGAATKPSEDPQAKVQLKRVTADGHLEFSQIDTSTDRIVAKIQAKYMEFDPTTHWLIARGTEREPVDFAVASSPGGAKTAEEVHYNLETGQVKSSRLTVRMVR